MIYKDSALQQTTGSEVVIGCKCKVLDLALAQASRDKIDLLDSV